jgi:hypothetical protein
MRMSILVTAIVAAIGAFAPLHAGMAQVDLDGRKGPPRSPGLIIEEPRPPAVAVETEGRGERRECRSVTLTERQNGVPVTRTEQQCDR